MTQQLRPANPSDYFELHNFVKAQNHIHRHLDWRDPLEWLGRQPFFVLEENRRIGGVFAAPAEPPGVAWVRIFGVSTRMSVDKTWQTLIPPAMDILSTFSPRPTLVSLALRDWYREMLERQGFTFHQDIVVFLYDQSAVPAAPQLDPAIRLRPLGEEDLEGAARIDHQSFESIWQLSLDDMRHAYQKSSYMTVAEMDGEIIGYQMSSNSGIYAHLSRLAVRPDLQGRKIGYAMVQDLLEHFMMHQRCWGVTLNTQHDNASSLALYRRIGFRETGERFPVFVHPV
jgi:ribosomal protein S18 acetylase RimI-like enzyme